MGSSPRSMRRVPKTPSSISILFGTEGDEALCLGDFLDLVMFRASQGRGSHQIGHNQSVSRTTHYLGVDRSNSS